MRDVVINLLASAIAAAVAWTAQYLVRYRKIARKRAFFGVRPGAEVLLFVARHYSSPRPQSVHRDDVASLVELATTIPEAGGLPSLVTADEGRREAGRVTEYCVGGPSANPRTAAHLRSSVPGVWFEEPSEERRNRLSFRVGGHEYQRNPGVEQYAVLARVRQSTSENPVFILAGQTALDNLAAARYLAANFKRLNRLYGRRDNFCLVLRLKETATFGADHVELVADVSTEAFVPAPTMADRQPVPLPHQSEPPLAVSTQEPAHE
jgi:hypothetical protein